MRRGQIFILIIMAILSVVLFGTLAFMGMSLATSGELELGLDSESEIANAPTPTATQTATPTPIPTNTTSPTPTDTSAPTPTATLVVDSTATKTPTKTPRPTRTPTPTDTPVAPIGGSGSSSSAGSSGGASFSPAPTPLPTSRYPLRIVEGPIAYETDNHFLVVLGKVTRGYGFLAGYRLVGFHSPTGVNWESVPSCGHLCKASGPAGVYNNDGELIERFQIQEGNLVLEFPQYEDGVFILHLVDPQGNQASEVFELPLDSRDDERRWFYIHFHQ